MGLAERKVQEIRQRRERDQVDIEWSLEASRVIRESTTVLWEALVSNVTAEVEQFAKLEPSAERLRAIRQSPTHLLVHTDVFPLVKLNIFKTADGAIQADLLHIPHRWAVGSSGPQFASISG